MSRLGAVNGLRGIAIFGVVWHHLVALPAGWSLLSNGWLGVNLFFLLSGLVLHLPYARGARSMEPRAFYRRRAGRLLPLYYVNVVVLVFIGWLGLTRHIPSPEPTELALLATITFTFTKKWYGPTINSPLWSLGIEVWFSVAFPALALLARRIGIARLVVGVAVLALAARFVGVVFPIFDRPHNPFLNPMKDGLLGRLDEFVLGMLLAELVASESPLLTKERARWLAPLGLVLLCLGATLWDLKVQKVIPATASPLFSLAVDAGAFALAAAAIASRGVLGRVLASPLLQVPGKMCFSIYVWHLPLWRLVIGATSSPERYILAAIVVVVVSVASYRFIEFRHERDWRALFRPDP